MKELMTVNSISNLGSNIIAELNIDDNDEIIINSSKDGILITVSVISSNKENNKIFILRRIQDFYIKEKGLVLDDVNVSKEFGKNIAINKFKNEYIIAISDTEYLSTNGKDGVGCVFIYRFIPISGKRWTCVKELTFTDSRDELRYQRFGNILEFVDNDLYIGCIDSYKKFSCDKEQYSNTLLIYKTDNYNHFQVTELGTNTEWLDSIINIVYVKDNLFYFLFILNKDLWIGNIKPKIEEPSIFIPETESPEYSELTVDYDFKGNMVCKGFVDYIDGDISNLNVVNDSLFITVYEKREFISHMFNIMSVNMTDIFDFLHNTIFHLDRKEDTKSLFYSISSNDKDIFITTTKTFKDEELTLMDNLEIVKIKLNNLSKEIIYSKNTPNKKETIESSVNINNRKKMLKVLDSQLLFIEDVVISDGRKKCLLKSKDIT